MNSRFHQLSAEVAMNAMPSEFRKKFLDGFSMELIQEYADIPYVPAKFEENEELHLNHSYKLVLKGRDLHKVGESTVLNEVITLAKGAENLSKEGKAMLVRYNIVKASHYLVDIMTYPHVNVTTWDKYHAKFEDNAATWLELHKSVVEELAANYTPNPMKSVPNRVRALAEGAYYDSLEFLPTYKRNGMVADLLWASMCVKQIYALMDWFYTFNKII
jgi:hypothetical protein